MKLVVDEADYRITQSISPTKQRQGSVVTRWPRLKNSEHAQSVEVIVGVVMGQKVVRPKPDRPYRLLRLWQLKAETFKGQFRGQSSSPVQ